MNALKSMAPKQAALVGLLIAVALYFLVFNKSSGADKQLKVLTAKKNTTLAKIQKLDDQIREARNHQDRINKLGNVINKIVKYIPKDMNSNKIMRSLTDAAKIAGVNIIDVVGIRSNTNKKDNNELYSKVKVKIKLEGNFTQIMIFLSNLSKLDNIVTLDDLEIKTERRSEEGMVTFQGIFVGYKYTNQEVAKK